MKSRKPLLLALAGAALLGGCATGPYYYNDPYYGTTASNEYPAYSTASPTYRYYSYPGYAPGYYYYAPPSVSFGLGYTYRSYHR